MKKIRNISLIGIIVFFSLDGLSYAIDKKEDIRRYMDEINPVLTKVQILSRNLSQKMLLPQMADTQMQDYIKAFNSISPPEVMVRQHKMILLSFRKLKMGFHLINRGYKDASISLVRRGGYLLRTAVGDIVEFAKKEGLIPEKNIKPE